MESRQVLVFSRRRAGVHVLPTMAGSLNSAKTPFIKFSASSTASSVGREKEKRECVRSNQGRGRRL